MNRIVITRIEHKKESYIAYIVLDENRKFLDLQVFEPEEKSLLGQIYVGYVEKVVPNIHAAFVRIGDGQKCYLPLDDLKRPLYARKQSDTKPLCEGDALLVQVTRDAVKTKDPVVSTKLTIHGTYCLLTSDNTRIGVSKKIKESRGAELLALARDLCPDNEAQNYGLVVRTNAAGQENEAIKDDILDVIQVYRRLCTAGVHQKPGELVYGNMPGYLARLKGQACDQVELIFTDQPDLYEEISLRLPSLTENGLLQMYRDDAISLATLYNIRGNLEHLLSSKVWLDSGANIIIESLETLTVIDVNSSKNCSHREEALFAINLEAAKEIARQLKLRNLSGMIVIDFINMKSEEQKNALITCLKQELRKDPVKANFIDITKLGLVEVTRKKVYKSLREVLQ